MNNNYSKFLKYKKKYIDLKKQVGGNKINGKIIIVIKKINGVTNSINNLLESDYIKEEDYKEVKKNINDVMLEINEIKKELKGEIKDGWSGRKKRAKPVEKPYKKQTKLKNQTNQLLVNTSQVNKMLQQSKMCTEIPWQNKKNCRCLDGKRPELVDRGSKSEGYKCTKDDDGWEDEEEEQVKKPVKKPVKKQRPREQQNQVQNDEKKYEKYLKMVKAGVPLDAVKLEMTNDGIDQEEVSKFSKSKNKSPSTTTEKPVKNASTISYLMNDKQFKNINSATHGSDDDDDDDDDDDVDNW